jgi:tetratricopeptide (TPR) repeat protein
VALGDIAHIRQIKGDVDAAIALHAEAFEVYEALGDRNGSAHARWSLGQIAVAKGDNQSAYHHLATSYAIVQKIGQLHGICSVGMDLGRLLLATGREAEAHEILERSRDGYLRLGQPVYAQKAQKLLQPGG